VQKDKNILNELTELGSPLAQLPAVNVFTVPDGYFDHLPENIITGIENQLSTLSFAKQAPVSDVPEGYFDGLADSILNKIKNVPASGSILTDTLRQASVYNVPVHYFDDLAGNILQRIHAEDKNELPASLRSVQQVNVFSVPAGYFDALPAAIQQQVPVPAKVIGINTQRSFFKYAMAAAFTGLLGLSLFTTFNKKDDKLDTTQSALVMADADLILKNNNFDQELESLGDKDIVQYLQSNGEDVKAALVASVTDEKTLPSEEEYYLDDQALDNFLNQLNISQTINN
jgi:hypothetical protein